MATGTKASMNWSSSQRDEYLDKVKIVDLRRLDAPYPPVNSFAAGTPDAGRQWGEYWKDKPLRDRRYNHGLRRDIVGLDYRRFKYIVPQHESVIFRDMDSKETVLVVLRDFIPDEDLRKSMINVCREIVTYHRDDRREDPGMLSHFGYTCGSRHDPQIRLAAACIRLDTDEKKLREADMNDRAQGMAGIVWNLMRSKFPPEIVADYNDTIRENGIPRMDMMRDDQSFTFKVGGEDVTFETGENGLELPPPSAMAAVHYARYTHTESNGNSWIVACTVNAPEDYTKGGNFYLASYGIMMLPATNTATAWRPWHLHGTTLYEMTPSPEGRLGHEVRKDGGLNTGMVFEVSKSLKAARKRSAWLDDCRKWKVRKATSPKVSSPKMSSSRIKASEVRAPKSGLPETKTEPPSTRYTLRPRTTRPNYYESDLELSPGSEPAESDFEDEHRSESETGPETELEVWTETESGTDTESESPTESFKPINGSRSI
ncbi:hypothetical protein Daesc_005626 [Daldinia eschscholtzii]|uniref:Uncharacterized protein n=1 Tax=Daldinia eschscholtzii TaxID=292717 RepID=A0AAX6MLJ6_9PEZI